MRASAETDLMDKYGLRQACSWSGNSASTAMKNYALVRKSDFEDVGMAGKCAAESDAILAAESASVTERKPHKKSTVENGNSLPRISVGDIGLELASKTRAKAASQQKLTPNATPSDLALLIQSSLSPKQVRELIRLLSNTASL